MPSKVSEGKSTNGDKSRQSSLPQFVQCELSDKDRKAVSETLFDDGAAIDFIITMCFAGVKVSLSYEAQNDCYGCYLTGTERSLPSFRGLCLVGRGPTLVGAVCVASYKHFRLLGEDWRSGADQKSGDKWR